MPKFLFLTFLILSSRVLLAEDCPKECTNLIEQRNSYVARLNNLNNLRQRNMDYLGQLHPSEASKRLKINSNILIAGRRINEVNEQIKNFDEENKIEKCRYCIGR